MSSLSTVVSHPVEPDRVRVAEPPTSERERRVQEDIRYAVDSIKYAQAQAAAQQPPTLIHIE